MGGGGGLLFKYLYFVQLTSFESRFMDCEHKYMNNTPPPPIIELVTPLSNSHYCIQQIHRMDL